MWRFAVENKGKCWRIVFDQDYLETSKKIGPLKNPFGLLPCFAKINNYG